MIPEIFALFAFFIILAAVGLGPSAWMFTQRFYPNWVSFAAAPTVGFAIVGLLSFPLFRYFAPVRFWAWPVTGVLLVISILIFTRTSYKLAATFCYSWRACVLVFGLLTILLGVRAAPLYVAGINHAVFAANPADAFTVMTLAESAHSVNWQTLLEGSDLANTEGVRKLAQESPTALFSARFLQYPIRMTSMVVLAFGANLFGIEPYRFYYPFKVVSLALAVPILLIWGWQLKLPRLWSIGLAAAFYLGFWAQMNLELDSVSQINALPLCLLLAFAITGLFENDGSTQEIRKSQMLIALLCASLCCYYPEYLFLSACAGAISIVTLLASGNFAKYARIFLLAGFVSIGILLASGQLIYLVRYQLFIAKWTATAGGGSSHPLMPLFMDDFVATLFGIYPAGKFLAHAHVFWLLRLLLPIVTGWLIYSIACYIIRALRTISPEGRVLSACIVSALIMYNVFILASGEYTAAKALIFSGPFLALAIGASLNTALSDKLTGPYSQIIGRSFFALWILSQLSIGAFAISKECRSLTLLGWSAPIVGPKNQIYDLGKIDRYLKNNPPTNLLVNVPPSKNWMFPIFCMLALNKYKPFFQSGLIYDNRKDSPRYFFQKLETVPDYAIVESGSDYIAEYGLGDRVASSGKLRLYKITSSDLDSFKKFNVLENGFVTP